jgi:hypothetical protein
MSSKGRKSQGKSSTARRTTQDDGTAARVPDRTAPAVPSESNEEVKRQIRASVIVAGDTSLPTRQSNTTLTEDANYVDESPSQQKSKAILRKYHKAPPFDLTYARRSELRSIFDPYVEKNIVQLNLRIFEQNRDNYLGAYDGYGDGSTRISRIAWTPQPWPRELKELASEATRHIQDTTDLLGHVPRNQAKKFIDTSPLDMWRAQTAIMSQMLDKKIPVTEGIFDYAETAPLSTPDLGLVQSPDYIAENLPSCEIQPRDVISCRICFDQLEIGSNNRYLHGDMNHIFCKPCIKQSLEHRFECPVCRAWVQL